MCGIATVLAAVLTAVPAPVVARAIIADPGRPVAAVVVHHPDGPGGRHRGGRVVAAVVVTGRIIVPAPVPAVVVGRRRLGGRGVRGDGAWRPLSCNN